MGSILSIASELPWAPVGESYRNLNPVGTNRLVGVPTVNRKDNAVRPYSFYRMNYNKEHHMKKMVFLRCEGTDRLIISAKVDITRFANWSVKYSASRCFTKTTGYLRKLLSKDS